MSTDYELAYHHGAQYSWELTVRTTREAPISWWDRLRGRTPRVTTEEHVYVSQGGIVWYTTPDLHYASNRICTLGKALIRQREYDQDLNRRLGWTTKQQY